MDREKCKKKKKEKKDSANIISTSRLVNNAYIFPFARVTFL